jgi:hypothetical protein
MNYEVQEEYKTIYYFVLVFCVDLETSTYITSRMRNQKLNFVGCAMRLGLTFIGKTMADAAEDQCKMSQEHDYQQHVQPG